ncbi:MAG TPA: hypothetical protein VGQ57_05195, partial [Polyangiaceae bacterium]|nr:hypothetical protein [Polyangiaceae bacterium]
MTPTAGRLGFALAAALFVAAPSLAFADPVLVDRTVVRFTAPELGGPRAPRFVSARLLALEARLEALADPDSTAGAPYREHHVSAALERHVAEMLLANLRIEPEPTADE